MDKRSYALRVADVLCRLDAFRLYNRRGIERVQEKFPEAVEFCLAHSRFTYGEVKDTLRRELQVLRLELDEMLSSLLSRPVNEQEGAGAGGSTRVHDTRYGKPKPLSPAAACT